MRSRTASTDLLSPAWAAVLTAVTAETIPAVLPVLVGVMSDDLAFGNVGAGYVASANMAGIGIGSVICAGLARHWSWRALITVGALLLLSSNAFSVVLTGFYPILSARFAAGCGEGAIAGICFAAMGRDAQPARPLAFYCAGQGLIGSIGMAVLPGMIGSLGWRWLFVLVAIFTLPSFLLARRVGQLQPKVERHSALDRTRVPHRAWCGSVSIFVYFLGMTAVWSFLEQMGRAKGIDVGHIALALSASSFANMLGALAVGFVEHHLSTRAGLLIGLAAALLGILGLLTWDGWQAYAISAVLFFSAWGFYYPFLFRLLAKIDPSGITPAIIPFVTGSGLAIGPAIGGVLMAARGTSVLCIFAFVAVGVSAAASLYLIPRESVRSTLSPGRS